MSSNRRLGGLTAASSVTTMPAAAVKEGIRRASHPWARFRNSESFAKFKQGLTHVGLFALFITYTVIGGKIFQVLEHSKEIERHTFMTEEVQQTRKRILALLIRRQQSLHRQIPRNGSTIPSLPTTYGTKANQQVSSTRSSSAENDGTFDQTSRASMDSIDDDPLIVFGGEGSEFMTMDSLAAQAEAELSIYEMKLAQAFELDISPWDEVPRYHWNFVQSVFFASTVITSIGYGNIAPKTTEGRVFCIIFALIGIPLTLTALTDLGRLLATCASGFYNKIRDKCAWVRRMTHSSEGGSTSIATKSLIVLAGLSLLTLYIAFGGMLFMLLEKWSFFEAFYFCFITMTTIGLGDLVPGNTTYTLFCTVYIFLGLALTSTTIELVRRQYAESWERMKLLSGRLAELSGPLSDTLKRLGEQAHRYGGDSSVDKNLLKELRELRKAVAITKLEMEREQGGLVSEPSFSDDFDFEPPPRPKVVWIIYETNV